jgi:hypothetical protein
MGNQMERLSQRLTEADKRPDPRIPPTSPMMTAFESGLVFVTGLGWIFGMMLRDFLRDDLGWSRHVSAMVLAVFVLVTVYVYIYIAKRRGLRP